MVGRVIIMTLSPDNYLSQFSKLDLPLHGVRLPSFIIDKKYKQRINVEDNISNYDFLRALTREGFKSLKLTKGSPEYKSYADRAKHELETMNELGFTDYILLVWDVINFCKEKDIATGVGRGSCGGSLVLFLIGVTKVDPIKHELFFERFISKTRAKKQVINGITYLDGSLAPDVDLDCCYYRRGEVLKYLEEKFKGKTAKILTLNSLSGKLLMKECGKIVASKPEEEMTRVTEMIPKVFGVIRDIEETKDGKKDEAGEYTTEPVEPFKNWCDANPEVYQIALKLRGLIKNKSIHPSGILLSYDNLEDTIPTELSSDKEEVSSFDMNWASLCNIKLDVLGLRACSVVDDVCKSVGITIDDIDLNSNLIYDNLQNLQTPHGIFQIEADTNLKVCRQVKPRNLEQVSGILALSRPGALQFVDQYADYVNKGERQSIHSFFDDVLEKTGGLCLYQESLMKLANKVGFSLEESEILRRIVGKKKTDEMKLWKAKIEAKVKERNLDPVINDLLWRIASDSASYSFNRSHSFSYGILSCICVLLKYKYPQQFYLSLLKMTKHEPDPISEITKIQKELHHFGIKLLPPHLLKSQEDFSIEGNDIRFGLLSIKGISGKSMLKVNNFRNKYANKFEVFHGAEEASMSVGILSALIQAGTMEDSNFKESRSKVVYEAQTWRFLLDKEKELCLQFGEQHGFDLFKTIKFLTTHKDEKGKPIIKAPLRNEKGEYIDDGKRYRFNTIRKNLDPYRKIYVQNSKNESLANWWYEKALLGYSYSNQLINIFIEKQPDLIPISQVVTSCKEEHVIFIGTVGDDVYSGTSKAKGTKYLRMTINDEQASCKAMLFKEDRIDNCKLINNGLPKEGNIVVIRGKYMSEGTVFADVISVQDEKIMTKLSQLKIAESKEKV